MVEAICFAIESSHYLSFHKKNFTRNFATLGSKNKNVYVLPFFF